MSRIIHIEVDLDDDFASLEIDAGIKLLEHSRSLVNPVIKTGAATVEAKPDGSVVISTAGAATVQTEGEVKVEEDSTTGAPPPPAGATTAPPPPADVDLDEEGLPWDARIHPASKMKLVKGGTWKLKRNLDPAFVEKVKAELRATMAAAPATTETSAAEAFGESEAPELPDAPMTFPDMMQIITERMAPGAENPLAQSDLDAALASVEIPTLPMMASRPDKIPDFLAELEAV